MRSIFDALYCGDVHTFDQPCSAEYLAKQAEFADLTERLDALLDRETHDRLFERDAALEDILRREAYAAGLRFGGRFVLELLAGDAP